MEVGKVRAEPVKDAIEPTIRFIIDVEFTEFSETPLDLQVDVFSQGKFLESIQSASLLSNRTSIRFGLKRGATTRLSVPLVLKLNEKMLEQVQRQRSSHPRGDAIFDLAISTRFLRSRMKLSSLRELDELGALIDIVPDEVRRKIFAMGHPFQEKFSRTYQVGVSDDPEYTPKRTTMWIISAPDGIAFELCRTESHKKVEIPVGHWIHDFIPTFRLGEHILAEIPVKALEPVRDLLERAEEAYNRWDTKAIYAHCREIADRLNKLIMESDLPEFDKKVKWQKSAFCRFKHVASLALHLEEIRQERPEAKILRADCEHLLNNTKLLIKYAGELLGEAKGKSGKTYD